MMKRFFNLKTWFDDETKMKRDGNLTKFSLPSLLVSKAGIWEPAPIILSSTNQHSLHGFKYKTQHKHDLHQYDDNLSQWLICQCFPRNTIINIIIISLIIIIIIIIIKTCHNDGLAKVFQHEGQGGAGVGESVRPVQDDKPDHYCHHDHWWWLGGGWWWGCFSDAVQVMM